MRLNIKKYAEILKEKNLTVQEVCSEVGILDVSFDLIARCGGITEVSTVEQLAQAAGVQPKEIILPEAFGCRENVIEFLKDSDIATVTFSQGRFKTKIRKLSRKNPKECQIIAESKNGSLYAHIPVSWIKIGPPRQVTENQRELSSKRMIALHAKPTSAVDEND